MEVTCADIMKLRTEARQAGDECTVERCWDALYHEDEETRLAAWTLCEEAVVAAKVRLV